MEQQALNEKDELLKVKQLLAEGREILKKVFDHFTKDDLEFAKIVIDYDKRVDTVLEQKEIPNDETVEKKDTEKPDSDKETDPLEKDVKKENWPY